MWVMCLFTPHLQYLYIEDNCDNHSSQILSSIFCLVSLFAYNIVAIN